MLSLSHGIKIATYQVEKSEKKVAKFVYIQDDARDKPPQIETTTEKKLEVFREYLHRDKKMRLADIDTLCDAYKYNTKVNPKLERKYDDAKRYVIDSLKHHLDFPKHVHLNPIISQPTYRMFISGLSGSGKSYYIAYLLKYNKPKMIFLMSPVIDDDAFKKLKPEPIHINLATYEEEFGKPFEIEDFPKDSVCILDDTDTAKDAKLYSEVKVQLLERGRHLGVSTIVVSHNPLQGNNKSAKSQLLESEFYVVFPKHNKAHCEKLLKRYVGLGQDKIDMVLNIDSRSVLIKKSYPSYVLGEHTIATLA
jgi:hypothetical protein